MGRASRETRRINDGDRLLATRALCSTFSLLRFLSFCCCFDAFVSPVFLFRSSVSSTTSPPNGRDPPYPSVSSFTVLGKAVKEELAASDSLCSVLGVLSSFRNSFQKPKALLALFPFLHCFIRIGDGGIDRDTVVGDACPTNTLLVLFWGTGQGWLEDGAHRIPQPSRI